MEEDRLGMRVQSETIELNKDDKGLVGISIGGGHPYCPCVYVVQVFDKSPADVDSRIRAGDEMVAVNGVNVKGEKKNSVAQLIKCSANPVRITINKLEADSTKGKTFDIVMKKVKHKVVEFMDQDSADALGLSRAILCNDPLLKNMKVMEKDAELYHNLIGFFSEILLYQEKIGHYQKEVGDAFCELAAHEKQTVANEIYRSFGDAHRSLQRKQSDSQRQLKSMVTDLETFVNHVVPDTQLTLKKYLDVKYEYLSYCLKLKELDDEEVEFHSMGEPLYRVETGNYEYRLMLRCRQETRQRFVQMRNDVMVKIELLDQKHVRDLSMHLTSFATTMKTCQAECANVLSMNLPSLPVEIDIATVNNTYMENYGLGQYDSEKDNLISTEREFESSVPDTEDLLGLNETTNQNEPEPIEEAEPGAIAADLVVCETENVGDQVDQLNLIDIT